MTLKIKHISAIALLFGAMLIFFAGCSKDDTPKSEPSSAVILADTVRFDVTGSNIQTTGDKNATYTVTITIADNDAPAWCSFSPDNTLQKSAEVGAPLFITLQPNHTHEERTAEIQIDFSDGYTTTLSLTQTEYEDPAEIGGAVFTRDWGEQPAYRYDENYIYKTYYTTLATGNYVRNYSICYDTQKRVSRWVAYPMHRSYLNPSIGNRVDKWAYDPNDQLPVIPESQQQYIIKSYGSGPTRGHMIANADRYSNVETNAMTFYATNMMPEDYDLNSGPWATLEGQIRTNVGKMGADTLYVVTGTVFGDNRTITDRKGNVIGMPTACWKVLLRTRSGNTGKRIEDCTADELIGIGFLYSNKDGVFPNVDRGEYDSSDPKWIRDYAVPIDSIEKITGFTFFRNIPADAAAAVKAQNNIADWSGLGGNR